MKDDCLNSLSGCLVQQTLSILFLKGAHEEIDYSAKLKFSDDEGDEEGEDEKAESKNDSRYGST